MSGAEEGKPLARPTAPSGSEKMTDGELFGYLHGCRSKTQGSDTEPKASASSTAVLDSQHSHSLPSPGVESRWMGISPSPFDKGHKAAASSIIDAKPCPSLANTKVVSRWMGISPSPFDEAHQATTSSVAAIGQRPSLPPPAATAHRATPRAMVSSPCKRLKAFKEEPPVKQKSPKPPVLLVVEQELQLPPPPHVDPMPEPEPVPEPEAPAGWGLKVKRFWRDQMFTYFPPGIPTKVLYQSNLKIAAAEVQRRLGTNENLDHLGRGSEQLATVLPGNLQLASETLLMKSFCGFCRTNPMPHPPPPPPPPAV